MLKPYVPGQTQSQGSPQATSSQATLPATPPQSGLRPYVPPVTPTATSGLPGLGQAKDTSPSGWAAKHPWLSGAEKFVESVPSKLAGAASFLGRNTAQLLAKPLVSVKAGLTGDYSPQNIPVAGKVTPFETPTSPASEYIGKSAGQPVTPEEVTAVKKKGSEMLGEAAKTDVGAYLEQGMPGAGELAGKAWRVAGELAPEATALAEKAGAAALKKTAGAFKWISQKSYAQATKALLGKETAQKVSAKVAERAPVGTTGSLIRQAEKSMAKFDKILSQEVKGPLGKEKINIDDVMNRADVGRAAPETVISSTGLNKQASMDAARQRLFSVADKDGNISMEKLQAIKQRWGNDIKPLFKKNPSDLTADQQADMDLYFAMRDAIAEKSPKLAAANAEYHYAKLVYDTLKRKETLELRHNWTSLIGNVYASHMIASGNLVGGIASLVVDKFLGGTLGRTLVGKGAKAVADVLTGKLNVAPEAIQYISSAVYNELMTREQEGKKLQRSDMMNLKPKTTP